MTGVTLITPTSDRPIAFSLCEYWMHRQTYDGTLQWIVADDGTTPVECRLGQTHIRRAPASDPVSSFCGNLIAALACVENDYVMFIEDDDWYRSDYIAQQVERLRRGGLLAGEGRARYYNLQTASWHIHDRRRQPRHSSLCQTAMKSECIPRLISQLKRKPTKFIDKALWSWHASEDNRLEPESASCIGIKGVPGKNNLALGDARASARCRNGDPHGSVLRKWIGDNDASLYLNMINDYKSQVLPEHWRKELPTGAGTPTPTERATLFGPRL